jgi:hypothetical protein
VRCWLRQHMMVAYGLLDFINGVFTARHYDIQTVKLVSHLLNPTIECQAYVSTPDPTIQTSYVITCSTGLMKQQYDVSQPVMSGD